ncbi:hypothetical protein AB0D27_26195 [Streptomyces sp. NPDC048415]|uniref:tyrosine-type recombinase/integrase n=1 Tax=Streptomyces sp. NPDC048415 TaxID=3154822 RepID=UPI00342340DD
MALQQFFKWLVLDEGDRSPMERVRQPKMPQKLIPVIRCDETSKVLGTCRGKQFVQLRDEPTIRLYCNTGARLSEVGNLLLDDIDLTTESVHFHGKGSKDRRVGSGRGPRGPSAATCGLVPSTRRPYFRHLWLAERGIRRLAPTASRS